jgi:PAS domain S-box-containing protein
MFDISIPLLFAIVVFTAVASALVVHVSRRALPAQARSAVESRIVELSVNLPQPPAPAEQRLASLTLTQTWPGATEPKVSVSHVPKCAEACAESVRSALDHSQAASAILDRSGRWLYVNEALCNMLGAHDASELAGLTPQSLALDPDAVLTALLQLESEQSCSLDCDVRALDGRRFPCRVAIKRHRRESGEGVFLVSAVDLEQVRTWLPRAPGANGETEVGEIPTPAMVAASTAAAESSPSRARQLPESAIALSMSETALEDDEITSLSAWMEQALRVLAGEVRELLDRGDIGAAIAAVGTLAHESLRRGAEVCAGDLDRIRVDLENGRLEAPEEIELLVVTALPAIRAAQVARRGGTRASQAA